MLVDSITLLGGSVVHNATIEAGASLPTTANSTIGELFYLTSGTVGLYLYNGTVWTIIPLTAASITKLSDLTNDVGFITSSALTNYAQTSAIPTKVSQLTNDSSFITSSALTGYALTTAVPTKTSQLTNDSSFITSSALTGYALTTAIPTKTSQLTNDSSFTTLSAVSGVYAPLASPTLTGRAQSDAYSYTVSALGSKSGTVTMDLAAAGEFTMTLTASATFVFTNTLGANRSEVVYLRLTNAGAAGVTITWPSSTKFAAATAPTLTAAGTDLLGVKYDTTTSTYMVFVIGLAIA